MRASLGYLLLFVSLGFNLTAKAQVDITETRPLTPEDSLKQLMEDMTILGLDSMWHMKLFENDSFTTDVSLLNTYNFPADSIPKYADSIYVERFKHLNNFSPFNFRYNPSVKKWMDLYVMRRRSYSSKLLGLKEKYFPMFDEMLDKYDLPLEIKYLSIVESGLNPRARSRSGAVGLWQFMQPTGKFMGLEINSYVDERRDPYKATEAACKYLSYLYNMYHDWDLALAAYNAGPGNVNRAMRRAGGKHLSYWQVRPYLPKETQNYVPIFYAVNYMMNFSTEHNIYPKAPDFYFFDYDTVQTTQSATFEQLAEVLCMDVEKIELLNPMYKLGVIPPPSDGENRNLYLPRDKAGLFVSNEAYVYSYTAPGEPDAVATGELVKVKKIHKVKSGENLTKIANRYQCSVAELRTWNNLRGTAISSGQKLAVYVYEPKEKATGTPTATSADKEFIYHTVQKGDTLWDIANQYRGVSIDKIKRMNTGLNERNLKTGTKIKVDTKG